MMNWPRNRIIFAGAIVLALAGVGAFLAFNTRPNPVAGTVTINVWGTDPKDAFGALAAQYSASRPNAVIKYSQISADAYEKTLLDSFIAGQGPDVFMVGNHDLFKNAAVLLPATSSQVDAARLDDIYPRAVAEDVVFGGRAYALPLYMDTLSLIYNRDLLDQAGIATPPGTWQELLDEIPALRKVNAKGQLLSSAIALGGAERDIAHASDILSMLMLQNGAVLTSGGEAKFGSDKNAMAALRFYTDFANPSSNAYAWNETQGGSMDGLASGKTAMVIGYHGDLAALKAKSPFLHLSTAPLPQVSADQAANFPSYQTLGVWRRSKVPAWAWDFVIFAATNSQANRAYLAVTARPPALRSLVEALKNDPGIGFYGRQSLAARSWEVPDYAKIKEIFSDAIRAVRGGEQPETALRAAEDQVNQLLR